MAKWIIHKHDDHLYKDGDAVKVDCSGLEDDVRVVHWDDVRQKGWIEFHTDEDGMAHLNQTITEFPEHYQTVVDCHGVAHAEREELARLWQEMLEHPDPTEQERLAQAHNIRKAKYDAPRRKD